jgi:hypothetical protein
MEKLLIALEGGKPISCVQTVLRQNYYKNQCKPATSILAISREVTIIKSIEL